MYPNLSHGHEGVIIRGYLLLVVLLGLTASLLFVPSPQERRFTRIEKAFEMDLSKVERPVMDDYASASMFSFVYPYFHFHYVHKFLGLTTRDCAAAQKLVSQVHNIYYPALLQNRARLVNKAKAENAYNVEGELEIDNDALNVSIAPYISDLQSAYEEISKKC